MFVQPHVRESLGLARLMTPNGKVQPDIRLMREHTRQFIRNGSCQLPPKQRGQAKQLAADIQQRKASLARTDKRWLTSVHEAAHAVAALERGVKFSVANITPDGETLGSVKLYGTSRSRPKDVLVAVLAGPLAQAKAEGKSDIRLAGGDLRIVGEQLRRSGNREQAEALYYDARAAATKFVDSKWTAIDAVARRLVNDKWLDESKVAAIVRESVRR